ncbi:hypothetical protein, partial [Streptococcus pneumoniae]
FFNSAPWLPLFDFITQQNPLKILIIQGVALYRYNWKAIMMDTTSSTSSFHSYITQEHLLPQLTLKRGQNDEYIKN